MNVPGMIIGYRKDGSPIRLLAGGSEPAFQPGVTPVAPVIVNVPPQVPEGQYFTAAQLEAARQQEKDKVYGRLSAAEEQVNSFKAELESLKAKESEREAEIARKKAEADNAARKAAEEKMSATELIAAKEKELLARQAAFEEEMRTKQAVLEREQNFLSMRDYISRRVNEEVAQDNIAPEFLDYITGNTEAEIEASITKAKEKTASIAEAKARAGFTQLMPGVSPTGFGPTGPLEQYMSQRKFTEADIKAMSNEEYAAYRKIIGIDKAGKDRGMFS